MVAYPINAMEISVQTYLIVFIAIQSIWTFILCPLSIYYTIQLWKLSKSNIFFISKRRPLIVYLVVIFINIYMIIFPITTSLPHHYHPLHDFHIHEIELILSDSLFLIAYIVLLRVWLLYYDYKYEAHLLSVQWKRHILRQRDYKPWTLRHRWMGNTKIIIIAIITIWIIACTLVELSSFLITYTNISIYASTECALICIYIDIGSETIIFGPWKARQIC